jgi:hypothetical protein
MVDYVFNSTPDITPNDINNIIEESFKLGKQQAEFILQYILVAADIRPGAWVGEITYHIPNEWLEKITTYFGHPVVANAKGYIIREDNENREYVNAIKRNDFPRGNGGDFLGLKFGPDGILKYFEYRGRRIGYSTTVSGISLIGEMALPDDPLLGVHSRENSERADMIQSFLQSLGSDRVVELKIETEPRK